jgi:dTDP-4-amino-4,6-dideoxygalactose transaminase
LKPLRPCAHPILANDFKALWDEVAEDIEAAVRRVGQSGWFILGNEVQAFEDALADCWGVSHAVGCGNGMDAIEISLRALGLKPGEKVLTTPLSAFATTLAITRAGGVPVFVDTDKYGLMDLEAASEALDADRAIRFAVPVHLYGHSIDLVELRNLRDRFDLNIVEDAAQSIGAASRGQRCGTVGQMAITSFYPTKNLGCLGDGGAVLTNSEELASAARELRDYGQSSKNRHDRAGMNSRLDELQAAILVTAMLPRLDEWTARRRSIARRYLSEIKSPHLTSLGAPEGSESVWHLFPLSVSTGAGRDAFQAYLQQEGIAAGIHYPILIPEQKALAGVPFQVLGEFENAAALSRGEISLPIHPFLSGSELDRVVDCCNRWNPHAC